MALLDFPDPSASPYLGPNGVIYTYVGTAPNGYWSGSSANDGTAAFDDRFVNIIGDTMTGRLTLSDDPIDALHAVTKQYVDLLGDGASIHVGDTEPADKEQGSLWWNTTDNTLYIYYDEGSGGTAQWVVSVPQGGGGDDGDYVSKIDTNSQNIVSDLTLGTDKITLNATDGNATFAGLLNVGDPFGSATIAGIEISPAGGVFTQSQDGARVAFSAYDQALEKFKVTHNGDTFIGGTPSSSPNISLRTDGSAEFAGRVDIADYENTGVGIILNSNGTITSSNNGAFGGYLTVAGQIQGGSSSGTVTAYGGLFYSNSAQPTQASIYAKNSNNSGNGNIILCETPTGGTAFNLSTNGSATFALQVEAGNLDTLNPSTNGVVMYSSGAVYAQRQSGSGASQVFRGIEGGTVNIDLYANGDATFKGTVTVNGNRPLVLALEPDNLAHYTTTTDSEGNETSVYNGPTLDVKDRLQNLISRLDAIEANEVVDDATDSALLQLVASLSARLDERDAEIAALTARVTTLES